jgi:hypothetical protein
VAANLSWDFNESRKGNIPKAVSTRTQPRQKNFLVPAADCQSRKVPSSIPELYSSDEKSMCETVRKPDGIKINANFKMSGFLAGPCITFKNN